MPTNLELKVKVNSHAKLKKLLARIKAEKKGIFSQQDIYYKCKDGLLKLRIENGRESLIYYKREEKKSNRWSHFNVIKFEGDGAKDFFNKLFETEISVKKKRELFYFDDTRIHLDTVKTLGEFLELETLVVKGKIDARKRFLNTVKLLELENLKEIRKSYRDLMIGKKRNK